MTNGEDHKMAFGHSSFGFEPSFGFRHSNFFLICYNTSMRLLLLLCVCSVASVVSCADDGWNLTTSDFKRSTVSLKSFDDTGVNVANYGTTQSVNIPLDKFLQLDRGAAVQQVRGTWTLYLLSGDRVGGEPLSLANDTLSWRSPAAGDLQIPVKDLRGLVKGQEPVTFDTTRTEDAVFLTNGDSLKGIVTGLEGGKLIVKQGGGDALPADLASIKAVHFAAAKTENATGRAFRIQLSDGSVVTAPKVKMTGNQLAITFGPGNERPIDLAQVMLIEQLNGPVSWLSARVPAEVVYTPMFDVSFPPQMDRNYKGEKIKFQGRDYARGIGVHAYCKLVYALDGSFKALRTQYALNEDAYKGKVTVRILLDDKLAHEAIDFKAGKLSPVQIIPLGNAKTVTLEVHPGGDVTTPDRTKWHIDTQARLNWLEPALLREIPEKPEVDSRPKDPPSTRDDPKPAGN